MPPSNTLTQELKETVVLILAGGQGERLKPLTLRRAKPAVPFGGAYRIIDFTLSNCIHSGLRRIHVLTQYRARSLEEHIRFGWNFLPRRLEQFITVLPPHHQGNEKWYQGTADAIYQNSDILEEAQPKRALILSGDHIYKMDYGEMLREHLANKAALTVGAVRIPVTESPRFGVFECDTTGRILSFEEKPARGKEIPGEPGWCLGSMGIYIFETGELLRRLREDAAMQPETSHDFGKDLIPRMIGEVPVFAHHFRDLDGGPSPYWRDVGTLDAYYEANLDLCNVEPKLNLYDLDWPIYSLWHADPPAKTVFADHGGSPTQVIDSLLAPGVVVSGARVRRSVISNRAIVQEGALIEDSILLGGVIVRPGARIRRAIIDKWTEVPRDMTIGHDAEADRRRFTVSPSGIVVVPARYDFGEKSTIRADSTWE